MAAVVPSCSLAALRAVAPRVAGIRGRVSLFLPALALVGLASLGCMGSVAGTRETRPSLTGDTPAPVTRTDDAHVRGQRVLVEMRTAYETARALDVTWTAIRTEGAGGVASRTWEGRTSVVPSGHARVRVQGGGVEPRERDVDTRDKSALACDELVSIDRTLALLAGGGPRAKLVDELLPEARWSGRSLRGAVVVDVVEATVLETRAGETRRAQVTLAVGADDRLLREATVVETSSRRDEAVAASFSFYGADVVSYQRSSMGDPASAASPQAAAR